MPAGLKLDKFDGNDQGDAALTWFSQFELWCDFHDSGEQKRVESFPFQLEGHAKIWYNTLPEETKLD